MNVYEALKLALQGYKVRPTIWNKCRFITFENGHFIDEANRIVVILPIEVIIEDFWEVYRGECPFKIGELVLMRDGDLDEWDPKRFCKYAPEENPIYTYQSIDGMWFKKCIKFDENIVFTNKPASNNL